MAGHREQTAKNNAGLQDDHDPSDIGRAHREQAQTATVTNGRPAAYAPHDEGEKKSIKPTDR